MTPEQRDELRDALAKMTSGEWDATGTMVVTPPRSVTLAALEAMKRGEPVEPVTSRRVCLTDNGTYIPTPQCEANARGIALLRNSASWLLSEAEAAERRRTLLEELYDDEPCRYDHHGYCQSHGLSEKPCAMERVRAELGKDHE